MNKITLRLLSFLFAAFLPPDEDDSTSNGSGRKSRGRQSYYERLGLQKACTVEEIRKAYKKKSLQHHPDKVAQFANSSDPTTRKKTKEEIQADFVKIQEAYEVLSDPDRRNAYDVLGEHGEKMVNPSDESSLFMLVEPQTLQYNLAHASFVDKTKLFIMIFLSVSIGIIGPILVCLKVDGEYETFIDAKWVTILIPFWIFHGLQLIIYSLGFKWFELFKTIALILGEVFLANKWDGAITWDYSVILTPIYAHQVISFIKCIYRIYKMSHDILRMVTLSYLEQKVLPNFSLDNSNKKNNGDCDDTTTIRYYIDLTDEERKEINKQYIIVQEAFSDEEADDASISSDPEIKLLFSVGVSPEYQQAKSIQSKAFSMMISMIIFRIPFFVLLILKLDQDREWNWAIVFIPIFVEYGWCVCSNCFACINAIGSSDYINANIQNEMDGEEQTSDVNNDVESQNLRKEDAKTDSGAGQDLGQGDSMDQEEQEEKEDNHSDPLMDYTSENRSAQTKSSDGEQGPYDSENNEEELPQIDSQMMEEQSKVFNSICSSLCMIIFIALFVTKLNRGEMMEETGRGPISAFWVAFQIFFISGLFLWCCCCCIYSRQVVEQDTTQQKEDLKVHKDDSHEAINSSTPAPIDSPGLDCQNDDEEYDLD